MLLCIEFITLVAKVIKCLTSLIFYLFSTTCLINSIKHEHLCKILYAFNKKLEDTKKLSSVEAMMVLLRIYLNLCMLGIFMLLLLSADFSKVTLSKSSLECQTKTI